MGGACSYSVSCPQLTQRMSHPCSWAGHRKIVAPWSASGGLMFLGLAQPHYLVVDVPRAVPRAASPPPVDCTLMPAVAVSSQGSSLVDVLPVDRRVRSSNTAETAAEARPRVGQPEAVAAGLFARHHPARAAPRGSHLP